MRTRCDWVQERLAGYREGWLSLGERQRVDRHLAQCPSCRHELEADARLEGLLAQASPLEVPEVSWSDVRAAKRVTARRSQPWRWAPAAAATLLLVALWLGSPRAGRVSEAPSHAQNHPAEEVSLDVAFLLSSSADPGGDPHRILLALPQEVSP